MMCHIPINGRTRTIYFSDETDLRNQVRMLSKCCTENTAKQDLDVIETNVRNIFQANRNNSPLIKCIL